MEFKKDVQCPYCESYTFRYTTGEDDHMYIYCVTCKAYREVSCRGPYWYKGEVKKNEMEA